MSPFLRVLVVDDDDLMRDALQHVFVVAGIPVETFDSAADLLARGNLHSPAVLLLDVKMPGMSGLALQVQLNERGVTLPIIFLTGASDVPTVVTAMRGGAVDFLEKPFNTAVLVDLVRHTFANIGATPARSARRPNPDYTRRLVSLTRREREVYRLMISGKTSKVIALELGGSFRTVQLHRARVMNKMAAASLAALVRMTFDGEARV
jgi:FixJ family two-component response regulator